VLELQLETISTCNARCGFCVYQSLPGRQGNSMSDELFDKITDEAASIKLITRYVMHGLGEPLLDKKIGSRIRAIRNKTGGARSIGVELFTNGVLLSPEKHDELADAGLSSIVVSLNAVNEEQHMEIMGLVGKFDTVCSNIENAIKSKKMSVQVHAVYNETFDSKSLIEFYRRWGIVRNGGYGQVVHEGNWSGDSRTVRQFTPNEECHRSMRQIYVTHDGKVTTCCFDPTGKMVFGDLNHQTIREVYASPEYFAFREAHSLDNADKYEICARCTRI